MLVFTVLVSAVHSVVCYIINYANAVDEALEKMDEVTKRNFVIPLTIYYQVLNRAQKI